MKKLSLGFKTSVLGALAAAVAMSTVAVRPASALILLADSAGDFSPPGLGGTTVRGFLHNPLMAVGCLLILPICFLDAQGSSTPAQASRQDLLDNGYSPAQADQLLKDQASLMAALKAKSVKLAITPQDSKESVAQQVRSVDPGVSDTYIDYLAGAAALPASEPASDQDARVATDGVKAEEPQSDIGQVSASNAEAPSIVAGQAQ